MKAWIERYKFAGHAINRITDRINGRYFMLGTGGLAAVSVDGSVWLERELGAEESVSDAGYGGIYVIVGDTIRHSSDTESWTAAVSGEGHFNKVIFHNGKFTAVGSVIMTSDDGKAWTKVSTDITDIYDIENIGDYYYLCAKAGLFFSTDMNTWYQAFVGECRRITKQGRFLYLAAHDGVYRSPNMLAWQRVSGDSADDICFKGDDYITLHNGTAKMNGAKIPAESGVNIKAIGLINGTFLAGGADGTLYELSEAEVNIVGGTSGSGIAEAHIGDDGRMSDVGDAEWCSVNDLGIFKLETESDALINGETVISSNDGSGKWILRSPSIAWSRRFAEIDRSTEQVWIIVNLKMEEDETEGTSDVEISGLKATDTVELINDLPISLTVKDGKVTLEPEGEGTESYGVVNLGFKIKHNGAYTFAAYGMMRYLENMRPTAEELEAVKDTPAFAELERSEAWYNAVKEYING